MSSRKHDQLVLETHSMDAEDGVPGQVGMSQQGLNTCGYTGTSFTQETNFPKHPQL